MRWITLNKGNTVATQIGFIRVYIHRLQPNLKKVSTAQPSNHNGKWYLTTEGLIRLSKNDLHCSDLDEAKVKGVNLISTMLSKHLKMIKNDSPS